MPNPIATMEQIVAMTTADYVKARMQEETGTLTHHTQVVDAAMRFTHAFQALQTSRLATSVEVMLTSPGIHPDILEALNRIATALESLERR